MAKAIVLACRGKLAGVFTQKKLVWEALKELEGSDCLEKFLIMADKRPAARHEVVELSYARLCGQLSEMGRADVRENRPGEAAPVKYALWQVEINNFDANGFLSFVQERGR